MYATNVRDLKKNPSVALRHARDEPVLILKGNQPDAVLLHLESTLGDTLLTLRPALASVLFRDGVLSLGAATKLSGLPLVDFIQHLSSLDIEIVKADETVAQEAQDVSAWLKL
ncbi:MAG: hypothetical protein BWK73_19870 [Thiothrix lacustris]|uniref:Prevent-host-death protein n=1 Tax=Thiothrix lacustris TaxID=525917 RepID=A0A1Y1QPP1_9GAMM|nr:MAG: hypothetical protein BWK73_19870 [Thiothrix lacustris]